MRRVRTSVGDRTEGYCPRDLIVLATRVRTLHRSRRLSLEYCGPNNDDERDGNGNNNENGAL